MQYLMSRYGGSLMVIGKGKASSEKIPEDQSLDNMLDNYATEIIPNHFYISSYDALPEWMGGMDKLYFPKTVKLGTLNHQFYEIIFQYDVTVTTDIYISYHQWTNIFAIFIKTHKNNLKYVIDDYQERYDYVLQVFIRSVVEGYDQSLKNNTSYIEKILLILFYKMGLIYEGDIIEFTPSKTYLGKMIRQEFAESLKQRLVGVETDDDLSKLLLTYENKNNEK
jgi:hypothetical protein